MSKLVAQLENPNITMEEVKELLTHLRNALKVIAKWTPTQYDDLILLWIDYLLGSESANKAQALSMDWKTLVQLVLPIILDLLKKWLESLTAGSVPTVPGASLATKPNTSGMC